MTSTEWKSLGEFKEIFKKKIFYIDSETFNKNSPKKSKQILVVLHGYPTSSFDYYKVIHKLSDKYRVIIHDHLGFGFSDKPQDYSYSLIEQADVALELWKCLNLNEVSILAHDYGTSIYTEIIARHNKGQIKLDIQETFLCNGSPHIEFSKLRTIQKLLKNKYTGKWVAKLTNYVIFYKNMRNVYFNKKLASSDELKEMWFQIEYKKGKSVIHKLSNYINERFYFWERWIGALKVNEVPTTIIWAKNDPIAIPKIAELLHEEIPNSQLYWIENCGHFLMLEQPELFSTKILNNEKV